MGAVDGIDGSAHPRIRAADEGIVAAPTATLLTVNGTGVADPFGAGFPADLARALLTQAEGMWKWQPVGYPAAAFPMGPSVCVGRAALCAQIRRHPGPVALSGYSQGALIVGTVWRDDILAADGVLHHRLDDVAAIVNYGDPMRCPGVANGNAFAGQPLPRNINGFVSAESRVRETSPRNRRPTSCCPSPTTGITTPVRQQVSIRGRRRPSSGTRSGSFSTPCGTRRSRRCRPSRPRWPRRWPNPSSGSSRECGPSPAAPSSSDLVPAVRTRVTTLRRRCDSSPR